MAKLASFDGDVVERTIDVLELENGGVISISLVVSIPNSGDAVARGEGVKEGDCFEDGVA